MNESFQLIRKNFKSVEMALSAFPDTSLTAKLIDPDHTVTDDDIRLMNRVFIEFERVVEIILNIFFRVVEFSETGSMSEHIRPCLEVMKKLSLVSSVEIWLGMIDLCADVKAIQLPEEKRKKCRTILSVYTDEFRFLRTGAANRYEI